jgi:hypothetical protein
MRETISVVGDEEWYLTDPYILYSDFGTEIVPGTRRSCRWASEAEHFWKGFSKFGIKIISTMPFGTVTITALESHPKPPSFPMMYPIQLDHQSYCQEFRCLLPLLVLGQLRSFPQFEIIECLVDVFDPKLPWALKVYEMRLIFGDSALGKLERDPQ